MCANNGNSAIADHLLSSLQIYIGQCNDVAQHIAFVPAPRELHQLRRSAHKQHQRHIGVTDLLGLQSQVRLHWHFAQANLQTLSQSLNIGRIQAALRLGLIDHGDPIHAHRAHSLKRVFQLLFPVGENDERVGRLLG